MKRSPPQFGHIRRHDAERPPLQISDLETPIPVVDLDRLTDNLDRMAAYTMLHGLALRPHVKTHKSRRIAADQVRLGAVGLTCATMREMEVMGDVTPDLLLAYPPIGAAKLSRLITLPRTVRITVAVDSVESIEQVAAAAHAIGREIGIYVELDLGMRRVGVQAVDDAIELVQLVGQRDQLRYAGIAFYPGHIREPVQDQTEKLERLNGDLAAALERLDAAGYPPPVVSGGSTPLAWRAHEIFGLNEVRPGTYVFNDRTTAELGACAWDDCALTVLATVVSTAVSGQAVIDAGSKALGREPVRGSGGDGFGVLLDRPEVIVERMSEEHGILDISKSSWQPRVGEQVRVIPNHVCVVVHLNDLIYGVRGDRVETRWAVDARGRERIAEELALV